MTQYFIERSDMVHVYKTAEDNSVLHINVTEPLINKLTYTSFLRSARLDEEISKEAFLGYQDQVLRELGLATLNDE